MSAFSVLIQRIGEMQNQELWQLPSPQIQGFFTGLTTASVSLPLGGDAAVGVGECAPAASKGLAFGADAAAAGATPATYTNGPGSAQGGVVVLVFSSLPLVLAV